MIINAFQKLGKLVSPPEPPLPVKKLVVLESGAVEIETLDEEAEVLVDQVGTAFFIEYKDTNGSVSKRRISVKSVKRNAENAVYLQCYCYERRAPRCFKQDRIVEAVDIATGQVFDHKTELSKLCLALERSLEDTAEVATLKALKRIRHGLNVLAFLSRCDEEPHPSESEIMNHYILDCCFDDDLDDEVIEEHIARLYPDLSTFYESLAKLSAKELEKVARYCVRLIEADGIIKDIEHEFMEDVGMVLKANK